MGMVEAVKSGLRNYANFQGRATPAEYWWWVLFEIVVYAVMTGLVVVMRDVPLLSMIFGLLYFAATLGLILPSLALYVRRLHDTDHSGWWIFLGFVPLVGGIVLLIWTIMSGTRGPNKYGSDPKAPSIATIF